MEQRELLKRRIEEEREKLNGLLAQGRRTEAYRQSLVVDALLEQYTQSGQKEDESRQKATA